MHKRRHQDCIEDQIHKLYSDSHFQELYCFLQTPQQSCSTLLCISAWVEIPQTSGLDNSFRGKQANIRGHQCADCAKGKTTPAQAIERGAHFFWYNFACGFLKITLSVYQPLTNKNQHPFQLMFCIPANFPTLY